MLYHDLAHGPISKYPIRIAMLKSGKAAEIVTPATSMGVVFAEGTVNIDGRKVPVTYMFDTDTGTVDPDSGWIGMDCDGDGTIDRGSSSPEWKYAKHQVVVFRVGERYVSTQSVDVSSGKIVLRTHPVSAYTNVELQLGKQIDDVPFTDFDGKQRKISEFRGKYVLLDFWATWCGPCVAEIPFLFRAPRDLSVQSGAKRPFRHAGRRIRAALAYGSPNTHCVARPQGQEVNVLLLMLLCFSLQSLLLSLDALFFGILAVMPDQMHKVFSASAYILQLLALATVFHFTFLTFTRVLDESGLTTDPFSILRDYKSHSWLWLCLTYMLPVEGFARYAFRTFRSWQMHSSGKLELPPMPSLDSLLSTGAFFAVWVIFTLRVVALTHKSRTSPHKPTVLEWIPGFFKIYPQHDSILRLSDGQQTGYGPTASTVSKDEWMASQLLSLWMILFLGFAINSHGGPADASRWSGVLWFLLPSVFVAPLIYYKMRFLFFDLLIKRGLIAILLLISSALYCGLILVPAYDTFARKSAAAGSVTMCAGTIVFISAWLALYGRLQLVLDRHLFQRSDYAAVISEIDIAMRQCVEPEQLLGVVTSRLRCAVDAESVEFMPLTPSQAGNARKNLIAAAGAVQRQLASAEIPVFAAERSYGVLKFGKRTGRFRYQSEDLAFLTGAASRLAEMLHNLELQSERVAQQQREQHLRALAGQSELRALRAQINPHFLFNALNSLADLTQEDPKAAEAAILHLSQIFRYALDASQRESVLLEEELSFVESYLALERLRFEDRLRYKVLATAEARSCRLPPMLIQPIVENAVKHGISCKVGGGTVTIHATVKGRKLHIEIADDGIGFDPNSAIDSGRKGLGLENVRSRLEHIGGKESFVVDSVPGKGTKVSLEIPAQEGEEPK